MTSADRHLANASTAFELDPAGVGALVAAVSDIALVIDADGVITEAVHSEERGAVAREWIGRRWVDTVTAETRGKVEALLRDAHTGGVSRRRQVNHLSPEGADIPVAYSVTRSSDRSSVVAVGRDLRAMAALQQRLVETQQSMERDYWRLRHVETRYRLLFQLSSEAVLVVDAATRRIVDANSAAGALFGVPPEKLHGRPYPYGMHAGDASALTDLLAVTRATGRGGELEARLAEGDATVRVTASCFRQDVQTLFLVRHLPTNAPRAEDDARVPRLLQALPDGFVVTDPDGIILTANQGFLDLAQAADEQHVRGRSIGEWLGRPGAELHVVLALLRKHGTVRLLATALRGTLGLTVEVEVSAVSAPDGAEGCIGFVVRDVSRRVSAGPQGARDLTRAVEQLTGLVGRVSLPDLLRDTVDMVERHFIEAALELTNGNRTAAAEVLGLSRQSVYVKLRRHGLMTTDEPDAPAAETA